MSKHCQLTGKHTRAGRNVAHSNVKTCRRFEPNLQRVHMESQALRRSIALRVSARALRTVQKRGGLDAFLLGTDDAKLPPEARRIKRRVRKALSG